MRCETVYGRKAMYKRTVHTAVIAVVVGILAACTGAPPGELRVVDDFQLQRYLGQWHEIARLDHRFERGLSHVTAEYSENPDGSVTVINRGYNAEEGKWEQATGRARFAGESSKGALEVSFFGPFYASYNIVALDQNAYEWALITGNNYNYLWILARQKDLAADTQARLVSMAEQAGFATDELIFVDHQSPAPAEAE
tara:strand:+ start:323302 stop:323892 length:591 start_codon:yes stop_codon:yes gene_type:complete